jgi:hypothetical protein
LLLGGPDNLHPVFQFFLVGFAQGKTNVSQINRFVIKGSYFFDPDDKGPVDPAKIIRRQGKFQLPERDQRQDHLINQMDLTIIRRRLYIPDIRIVDPFKAAFQPQEEKRLRVFHNLIGQK